MQKLLLIFTNTQSCIQISLPVMACNFMTIESVYHEDICNLDHTTSRTLNSHFWPRRMTHYDLSDHIRISVVILIPILHQLGISLMVYLIPHISPNYFQTNEVTNWVQKKKRECRESSTDERCLPDLRSMKRKTYGPSLTTPKSSTTRGDLRALHAPTSSLMNLFRAICDNGKNV